MKDDRWLTYPWGILGGKPGMRSEKILVRKQQGPQRLPSKCDEVQVQPGDMLIYRTAGGGGWKNPLDGPMERVESDVSKGLVSKEKAEQDYGVIVGDAKASERLRKKMRAQQKKEGVFDRGPALEEILSNCREETGLEPPVRPEPLPWAALESPEEARQRVREHGDRQTHPETGVMHHPG